MTMFAHVGMGASIGVRDGGGTSYIVQTPSGVLYSVYIDNNLDVAFRKSLDGGLSWSNPVVVFAGTAVALSVWYDRWSGISAGLIHCAYTESVTDDTLYRTINTESSDALSTQTVIFAGASTAANGGHLSIVRARGGNVYCKTVIDAGAEGGFFRLTNANVPNGAWASRTIDEAVSNTDQMILMPGYAADDQDIMAFFWDASAAEISRKLHDDSANTWSETSIATSFSFLGLGTAFPQFAACPDLSNNRNIFAAWPSYDAPTLPDLRCWLISESAITEVTNIILDAGDDVGLVQLALETEKNLLYAFYTGKSDGAETIPSDCNAYYKVSPDFGTTWGPERAMTEQVSIKSYLRGCPRFVGPPMLQFWGSIDQGLVHLVSVQKPRASHQIGM